MKKNQQIAAKLCSVAVATSMVLGLTTMLAGCGSNSKETVTLEVYSQLANYSGMQTGWGADILKKKFNVKLNIIPDGDGVYETRMESGSLGDIVIWGSDSDQYINAVKQGLLYDWNEEDILSDYGKYIKKNMPDAISKNQKLTKKITDGKKDNLYGIGNDIAMTNEDHQLFIYNWDVRWDLYEQLGCPEIKDMKDFAKLLKDMQKICPKDEAGKKTYAVSLWPDWDVDTVCMVRSTATGYYGYDELGVGMYDCTNGKFYGALDKDGAYLEMTKFYNDLYQDGLFDPDSMSQTYDKMIEKVQNGGVLFSLMNFSGSCAYNKETHTKDGKMMYCLKPENATPIVYGMNTQGGSRVTSIGANTEYPELCMEILNYFATPEGRMTMSYGPKGDCWDYDKDGNTYFTELGKSCHSDANTKMGSKYKGTYQDGTIQASVSTWSIDAENPDSNGETYNSDDWKSNNLVAGSDIEQKWRDFNGVNSARQYFEKGNYTVSPGSSFSVESKSDEFKTTWSQVTDEIKNGTWKAIYAKTDAEFDKIVNETIKKANAYGYKECVEWSQKQADERFKLEQEATQKK